MHPGEGDLEEKPAEALEKGLELFSKEFWDSGSLHHVRGEGASLGAMFHWSHGCLTWWQGGIMKLAQSGIFFDGNTAWDFSKPWLLSLRSIEEEKLGRMPNKLLCQSSCSFKAKSLHLFRMTSFQLHAQCFATLPSQAVTESTMWKIDSEIYYLSQGPYVFYFKRGCTLNYRNKFANDKIFSNTGNISGDRNFLDINLYLFARVAVTNYHKPGGLPQQKCMFHRCEDQSL